MDITRLFCLLFTLLLLTSVTIPAAAEPVHVAFVVIGGVEIGLEAGIVIAGAIGLVAVKEALEQNQDDFHTHLQKVADGWNNLLSGLSGRLDAQGDDAKKLLKGEGALYEYVSGVPGGKGKLDKLKVYHISRKKKVIAGDIPPRPV